VIPAAVYLRVSSKGGRQDEANQEPDCVRLCEARGWEPRFFREQESGAKFRPVWRNLIEQCRRGQLRAVVFWALDRTGRSRVQIAHDLSELARFGVAITSVQDSWVDQPPGPLRDLLIQVMGWVAEGERARLRERTIAGQKRARAAGKRIGRTPVDVKPSAIVRAYVLRLQGQGWRTAAGTVKREGLGDYDAMTLKRRVVAALKNGSLTPPGKIA
jgi:DNA invertase Pin-like site-specific DNA recombinase